MNGEDRTEQAVTGWFTRSGSATYCSRRLSPVFLTSHNRTELDHVDGYENNGDDVVDGAVRARRKGS